jgi:transposase InsO family protein
MGIEALYRRPNTSNPADGHKIYPYLLRNLAVEWPNQVWAMDITYIPMARGFVYLAAVVDWFSRRVLAWRLSITLEVEFCLRPEQPADFESGQVADIRPVTGRLRRFAQYEADPSGMAFEAAAEQRGWSVGAAPASRGRLMIHSDIWVNEWRTLALECKTGGC